MDAVSAPAGIRTPFGAQPFPPPCCDETGDGSEPGVLGVAGGLLHTVTAAPTVGWIAFSAVFLAATWWVVGPMDPAETSAHATREDPTTRVGSVILTVASVASLGGVALVLLGAQHGSRVLE